MADISIVSASLGGYDVIRPQAAQDVHVDWWMVTDGDVPAPWTAVPWKTCGDPRLAAKAPKMTPAGLPVTLARHVVWIDANMEVTAASFAREAVDAIRDGVAVWRHPERDCIYDEADASIRLAPAKYAHLPIVEQVDAYRAEGHPAHGGLYACGTVAWDLDDERALRLGAAWLVECARWTIQDQLSFPVVCRRLGVTPGVFPVEQIGWKGRRKLLHNRWLRIHPHLSDR